MGKMPLKIVEKIQLIQRQVCYAYELGYTEGFESAQQDTKEEKIEQSAIAKQQTIDSIHSDDQCDYCVKKDSFKKCGNCNFVGRELKPI